MRARAIAIAGAFALAAPLGAQAPVPYAPDSVLYVRRGGGGGASDALELALDRPHVVLWQKWNTYLPAAMRFTTSVVVLNSDATVRDTIDGDVVVINGSLTLGATAKVGGRALAFGGNIYADSAAQVAGGRQAYPAARFDTVRTERGIALDYRGPPQPPYEYFHLPGLYGVTVPLYDRVDGLSVGWYPSLTLRDSVLVVSPGVTYRSNIGRWDGSLTVATHFGGGFASVSGARTTLSNDDWIQSDIGNSVMVLAVGKDFRNYWRSDEYEARVGYVWSDTAHAITLWAGARQDEGTSIAAGGPWAISGTSSSYSMYRPNPAIDDGTIKSWLTGLSAAWGAGDSAIHVSLTGEHPWHTPNGSSWTQITIDANGLIPVRRDQDILFRAHGIYTSGDSTPAQRYGYLGGAGSLLTMELLSEGGDQLAFLEGDYRWTLSGIRIPYTTSPSIAVAYTVGAAGVGSLPSFTSNIGARAEVRPFRLDAFVDPRTGKWRLALLFWFVR